MKYPVIDNKIKQHFPNETILNNYTASLISEVEKISFMPIEASGSFGPLKYSDIHVIETANYWFVDLRFKPTIYHFLFWFINILTLVTFFGRFLINLPVWFIFLATLTEICSITSYIAFYKGYLTKVYEKQWVLQKLEGNRLSLSVALPKYSSDSLWKRVFRNKILDFIGITITSAPLSISYIFTVTSKGKEAV